MGSEGKHANILPSALADDNWLGIEDASSLEEHHAGQNDSSDSFELSKETHCPSTINEKSLMRRVDLRVLPVLFIIYFAAFLDRYTLQNLIDQAFNC